MVLQTVKLAILLFKQITRPIVHQFAESAKNHEKFRSVIERIGQRSHAMDLTLQSTLFGFRKPKQVIALSTDDAFTKGTKILGETLVYVISASILLYEYHKSQIKDYDKTIKIDTILRAMHFQEEKIDMIQKDIHSYEDEIKKIKRDINLYEEDKSQIQNDIHLYEEKLAQLQKDIFLLKRKLRPKLII